MALREFADGDGRRWMAWEVHPHVADALLLSIGSTSSADAVPRTGWLAFESDAPAERRRLRTFPPHWSELPDADLIQLCQAAEAAPIRRRLIE